MSAKAMFGAGCFWGVQSTFKKLDGVKETAVGYAGGHQPNPTYEQVCSGQTGHAEVVYLEFDPEVITYETLLDTFWSVHDPTQVNRQGPDLGTQYRSVIFHYGDEQKQVAEASKSDQEKQLDQPIATSIELAPEFWRAEDYHQNYLEKKNGQ